MPCSSSTTLPSSAPSRRGSRQATMHHCRDNKPWNIFKAFSRSKAKKEECVPNEPMFRQRTLNNVRRTLKSKNSFFPEPSLCAGNFSGKKLQASHNSWDAAMSKGKEDCFPATLFHRGLIKLPGGSQGDDNLHSTCPPICALGSFLYTVFPWRGGIPFYSWSYTPRHTSTGTHMWLLWGTRPLCWFDLHRYPVKCIYNVNFPEFHDTAKIREGPCILRSLSVLLFEFHYNTSKCLRKQVNYKSQSSFSTCIKILLKWLAMPHSGKENNYASVVIYFTVASNSS